MFLEHLLRARHTLQCNGGVSISIKKKAGANVFLAHPMAVLVYGRHCVCTRLTQSTGCQSLALTSLDFSFHFWKVTGLVNIIFRVSSWIKIL